VAFCNIRSAIGEKGLGKVVEASGTSGIHRELPLRSLARRGFSLTDDRFRVIAPTFTRCSWSDRSYGAGKKLVPADFSTQPPRHVSS
jgi:hypothetical protein